MRLLFRLNLPPGRYQLRAAAHETGAGAGGSVHYDVEVPDFDAALLSMSGLVLTSTTAAAIPTPRPDPELQDVLADPPTGLRRFRTVETVGALFVLYCDVRKTLSPIDVVTTVGTEGGPPRFRSESQVSADVLREAKNGYASFVTVPLAEMPPGRYVLRVQATSRVAGSVTAFREVPFEVEAASTPAR
jgi:hypothetical protein